MTKKVAQAFKFYLCFTVTGQRPHRTRPFRPWRVWDDVRCRFDLAGTPETFIASNQTSVRVMTVSHLHRPISRVPTSGFPVESSWSLVRRSRRFRVRMLSLSLPLLEPLSTWAFHSLYSSNGEQRRNLHNRHTDTDRLRDGFYTFFSYLLSETFKWALRYHFQPQCHLVAMIWTHVQ